MGSVTHWLATHWYEVKLFAQHSSGVSLDAWHVVAGVMLQLLAALVLRSSIGRPMPLLVVLVAELFNEAYDFAVETWPHPGMQFGEGAKDVVLTMLLPTLLFLTARYRPKLLRRN